MACEDEDAEHLDFAFAAKHGDMIANAISNLNNDPTSIAKAQLQPDWPQWRKAMDCEIETLKQASTWCRVPYLEHTVNLVGSKWVFHIKCNANSSIDKYKACLIA